MTPCFQVAEFVSEVDALHSELEALENSARVSFLVVFCLHVTVLVTPFSCEWPCPVSLFFQLQIFAGTGHILDSA